MSEMPIFTLIFEHQPNFARKWAPKNDNLSHFAKHRLFKKKCCNPPLDQKLVCFNSFFITKNTDVEQKHIIKSGRNTKIRKRELKEKTRQIRKPIQKGLMRKLSNLIFDVVLCMKQKQRKKAKNKERNTRKQKRAEKKEKKEGTKNGEQETERERDIYIYIEREWKGGREKS